MPPRRRNKKHDQDDLQLDKKQSHSKWAKALDGVDDEEQAELIAPKKQIFQFDFSKQHRLLNQKQHVHHAPPVIQLTEQEKIALEKRLEKERIEKEEKERIRREKKAEKKKRIQKERQEEQARVQQELKEQKQLQQLVSKTKGNSDSKKILFVLLAIMVCLGLLQYQKDIYAKLSKFRITSEVNFYEVLQVSSSVTDADLKNQYKKLVIKYHPDKNPNCHSCKDKFNAIMQAWQVLGNPEKRKHYDQNSGYVSQIASNTLTLTPDNYQGLVYNSNWIWIIQVYDSTEQLSHYFAPFWQEFAKKYEGHVKVGRIDVWHQSQMKGYSPYKFQIFPGVYSYYHGQDALCQLDYDRPIRTLELCVESVLNELEVTKISDLTQIPQSSKVPVILGNAVKLSTAVKLIHSRYNMYIDFYMIQDKSTLVKVKGRQATFDLKVGTSKIIYKKYAQFLAGIIKQSKTECQVHYECRDSPCLLLLDNEANTQAQVLPFALMDVQGEQFVKKVEQIKNMTGLLQRFQVGFYQDGKIQLGYLSELEELRADNGQVIDFVCRRDTIFDKLTRAYDYISSFVVSK